MKKIPLSRSDIRMANGCPVWSIMLSVLYWFHLSTILVMIPSHKSRCLQGYFPFQFTLIVNSITIFPVVNSFQLIRSDCQHLWRITGINNGLCHETILMWRHIPDFTLLGREILINGAMFFSTRQVRREKFELRNHRILAFLATARNNWAVSMWIFPWKISGNLPSP